MLERHADPRQKRLIAVTPSMSNRSRPSCLLRRKVLNGASLDDFRSAADFHDPDRWIPERRIRFSAGWGTLLTNDFRSCNPQGNDGFNPVGLVCKLSEVDGRPAVKLSTTTPRPMGDPPKPSAIAACLAWRALPNSVLT